MSPLGGTRHQRDGVIYLLLLALFSFIKLSQALLGYRPFRSLKLQLHTAHFRRKASSKVGE